MGQIHLADRIVLGECDESVMGAETDSPVPGRDDGAEIPENAVLFSDENGEVQPKAALRERLLTTVDSTHWILCKPDLGQTGASSTLGAAFEA
jgi:hypothetical protein